jgi:pyruvate/2-oxoglutarate/acetoin dehydrogenase E1 component
LPTSFVISLMRRVAAKDTFVAYQPILEDSILPQPNNLYMAMKELAEYKTMWIMLPSSRFI